MKSFKQLNNTDRSQIFQSNQSRVFIWWTQPPRPTSVHWRWALCSPSPAPAPADCGPFSSPGRTGHLVAGRKRSPERRMSGRGESRRGPACPCGEDRWPTSLKQSPGPSWSGAAGDNHSLAKRLAVNQSEITRINHFLDKSWTASEAMPASKAQEDQNVALQKADHPPHWLKIKLASITSAFCSGWHVFPEKQTSTTVCMMSKCNFTRRTKPKQEICRNAATFKGLGYIFRKLTGSCTSLIFAHFILQQSPHNSSLT